MSTVGTPKSAEQIQHDWDHNPRWKGITRTYTEDDVDRLRGSFHVEHTVARADELPREHVPRDVRVGPASALAQHVHVEVALGSQVRE